jgi:hypothetical protein
MLYHCQREFDPLIGNWHEYHPRSQLLPFNFSVLPSSFCINCHRSLDMKLPHVHEAIVAEAKLVDYLLNSAHPDNGGKAAFFMTLGFSIENWLELAAAFRQLAKETEVVEALESSYGTKYVLDGWLQGRDNKQATVRSIWIVDRGTNFPRLVTAYPIEP